jgi:hypothetical protein
MSLKRQIVCVLAVLLSALTVYGQQSDLIAGTSGTSIPNGHNFDSAPTAVYTVTVRSNTSCYVDLQAFYASGSMNGSGIITAQQILRRNA